MKSDMSRSIPVCAFPVRAFLICAMVCVSMVAASACGAQQSNQSDQYQGTSSPPPNDQIISNTPQDVVVPESTAPALEAKPSPSHPALMQPAQPAAIQSQDQAPPSVQNSDQAVQSASVRSPLASPEDGTDKGVVQIAPEEPALSQRAAASDPDGDIVHPAPLGPNELGEGTMIRVRLLGSVSTAFSEEGDSFRSRVATDVLQDGKVLIPAGAEIDGRVTHVSTGSFAGHGSMRLSPESVILPDGSRFRMYAQVTATPGAHATVGSEGSINPGSQLKKDGIEYGGAVGTGAVTGAVLGGPAGALAGTLVGAGVITAHLLISHPQATLDEGTVLDFMLTEPLNLVPAGTVGN